ncbi:MAG: hypothetical protein IVW36_06545 [Dehalococcoidia bacterium]|nr:hypothetical protein [Dehalococcoidia bacterium]
MKLTNEHRHVPVQMPGGRRAEGIVQVRGIDLRLRRSGIVVETRRPVAVLVGTPDSLRRLAIDEPRTGGLLLTAAVPVAAFAVRRLMRRRRRAGRSGQRSEES